jgi:tetratricopeptide (TPR) repeat protein
MSQNTTKRSPMPAFEELLAAAGRHYQSGRRDLAIECLQTAIRERPNSPEAHNNLGLVLAQEGRLAEAAARFRNVVRLKPDFADGHSNLGNALQELGSLEEAAQHLQEALRLRPGFAVAHNNLGVVLLRKGNVEEAVAHFQAAIRLQPQFADAHNNLGSALLRQGILAEAASHLHLAVRLRPDWAEAYYNLGLVLHEQAQLPAAETHLRRALHLKSDYAEAYNALGLVLHEQNQMEEAHASFEQALRLKPNDAPAHCSLGRLLEDLGELDAAIERHRHALSYEPGHAGTLAALAHLQRARLPESELSRIKERLDDPRLDEPDRVRLLYGLAHVLDGRGEYGQAAAHMEEANALELERWRKRGQAYDRAQFSRFVDRLEQTFSRDFFDKARGWGVASERPVFIFGLPRSGTTLAEQILASHSQVYGGGELTCAKNDFVALAQLIAGGGATVAAVPGSAPAFQLEQVFGALAHLDSARVDFLARQHLHWLEGVDRSRPRITSKTPADWQYVGLLAILFPRARFIHCLRNLRDTAVSCWMTQFRMLNWTCDQDDIACRFNDYQRLMAHWRACLPVPMLELDYEDTVADLEGTARRLVSCLGLEWEPACLNFHQTRRQIRTASASQVRRPIYRSSVGRWQHYESALGPLFTRLADSPKSLDAGHSADHRRRQSRSC